MLNELADITVLAVLSTCDSVIERADRGDIELLFVDTDAFDVDAIGRALAAFDAAPEWFAVTTGAAPRSSSGAQALLLGAAGVVHQPIDIDPVRLRAQLRACLGPRISEAAHGRLRSRSLGRQAPEVDSALPYGPDWPKPVTGRFVDPYPARRELLAIGCSTGGPPAVASLIQGLPSTFRLPICVVQHMSAEHMSFFAEGLSRQLARPVSIAQDDEAVEAGQVYVAAGAAHMVLERQLPSVGRSGLRLRIDHGPPEHNCRPAVDPFFRSVAAVCGAAAIGVVLTGMGADGARGARAMRDAGAPVLAQDAASSVVWGMPGATYQAGAACAVLPLDQLAKEISLWTMPSP